MGLLVQTTCRICSTVASQVDGPLMSGYRPRCVACGEARLVTPEQLGDDPGHTPRERQVTVLAGPCSCGRRFTLEAPLRCPRCRSSEIDVEHEGFAD
jgi:hypothetical protein